MAQAEGRREELNVCGKDDLQRVEPASRWDK